MHRAERLRSLEIRVGNTPVTTMGPSPLSSGNQVCRTLPSGTTLGPNTTITCVNGSGSSKVVAGRYLSIQILASAGMLTLCEVKVYGYPAGEAPNLAIHYSC